MTKRRKQQIEEIIDFMLKKHNSRVTVVKDTEGFQGFEHKWKSVGILSADNQSAIVSFHDAQRELYAMIAEAVIFNPKVASENKMAGMNKRYNFDILKARGIVFGAGGWMIKPLYPEGEEHEYQLTALVRLGDVN